MSFYKREDPDPENWTPHHSDRKSHVCRGCGTAIVDQVNFFNGWPWHPEPCYREIVALYMSQPQPVTEEDAVEVFKQRTRR